MLTSQISLIAGVGLSLFALCMLALAYRQRNAAEEKIRSLEAAQNDEMNKRYAAFENMVAALESTNAQLQARTEELVGMQEGLHADIRHKQLFIDLSQSLTASLELKTLLSTLLRKLRQIIGFHAAGVFLYNQDKTDLMLAASDGLNQPEMESQLSPDIGIPAIVAQTERPLLFTDMEADPRLAPIVTHTRLRSAVYHPIMEDKQVYGVICLWSRDVGDYTQQQVDQLSTITGEAARAIRNAEIYQEMDSRLNFIVTLWETSKNLNTSAVETDSRAWHRILDEVMSSTRYLFGAEKAVLFRYDKGRRDLFADLAHGFDSESLPMLQNGINQSNVGLPFVLRSTFQVKDLTKDHRFMEVHRVASRENLHGMLWAPLTGRQRTIGALALFSTSLRTWSQLEMQWLDIFTNMFSVTLENVHLFQDLASEKSQLQVLVDNVPEGVFTTDAQGRISTWNAAAQRITGWTLSEVSNRPCADFIKCQTVDEVWCRNRCPLRIAMHEQAKVDSGLQNVAIVSRRGDKVPVFITSGPIYDEEGRIAGSILVFRDITKEKEIEQMKEDFLATISHDLKSPLASVMGYAELLLNPKLGEVGPTQKEFVEAILRSSKTLQFLIDNILEITRMEAGKMVFNPSLFNVSALLAEIKEMFLPLAVPKNLALDMSVEDPLIVRGDRDKLKEVFINLYSNAIKFTRPSGRITTRVTVTGDRVQISVSDTGKGIPQDQVTRLFEKFAQIRTDERRGTGLGLYIVRRIIQAHGEDIEVQSEVGVGTTFSFGLPRARANQNGKGLKTVLVLEPDEDISDQVQRALEDGGIDTMLATSAGEALRAIQDLKPHVVVVDSKLPEIVSDDLLTQLKTVSAWSGRDLRVLLLCEWRDEAHVGADMQICRPLDSADLLHKVRSLIQH